SVFEQGPDGNRGLAVRSAFPSNDGGCRIIDANQGPTMSILAGGVGMFRCVAFGLMILICATSLFAQFTTASLGGEVRDPSGSAVPEARVTVRNVETGFTQTVVSDAAGAFLFSRVPVGNYELRVEKAGFTGYVQSGIHLTVDRAATQNVTLQVGAVTEAVTVQAEAELIQTRTATSGALVDGKQIVDMPLNGRRPERLVYMAPGTIDLGRNSGQTGARGGFYRGKEPAGDNGAGIYQANFKLAGTSHNDTYINVSLPFPNPDSVQEFSLQSSNFT